MKRVKSKVGHYALLLPLSISLLGCVQTRTSAEAVPAAQPPLRAIISFVNPSPDNQKFSAEIADACRCQPVFIRPYSGNALIYQVALPAGHTFAAFEQSLMQKADKLGISMVEQDVVLKHQ
jgi:hypothetical protein